MKSETKAKPKSKSSFSEAVHEVVRSIKPGRTISYSRVAMLAGRPGAPRAVTRVLRTSEDLPWWRVIRADGSLAVEVATEQARRLRQEGVEVKGRRVVTIEKKHVGQIRTGRSRR
jgi:methylated-DNA-protein-cysteine methyltransferase-like protein